ncbi:bifunctional diguanylate cyclase/phosphodiesterase [Metabacillus sediminilitoris]|nr:bifunctional diguanylate cyclase/phosphodiesterase [Metabacillus sediminilitoris]
MLEKGEERYMHEFLQLVFIPFFVIVTLVLAIILYRTVLSKNKILVKLRESEDRFLNLVELSPDAIVVHCEEKIIFINEAGLNMVGASNKDELIGKSIIDFVPPDYKEIVVKRIQQMKNGHKAKTMEQQIITPQGNIMDVEITGTSIMYEHKPGIQLIIREITEQKRISRELEEKRQRYQSLFEHNPDGIYSLDPTGKITETNQALVNMLGYTKDELLAMTFHKVISPDLLAKTSFHFQNALEGNQQYYETVGIHKNGKKIHLHSVILPIIVDSKIIGVFGIAKDISKEKEALLLLEENEEKYRSLFDHNLDSVFEMDLQGHFKNVNHMAEKLTHFSKKELLTMTYSAIIANNEKNVNKDFSSVIKGYSLHVELELYDKFGRIIEVDISAVPIKKHGRIDGVFAIVRDITEKKQSQKKIKELAYTDQLTGLPNRHWFYKKLTNVTKNSNDNKQPFAILTIDFDDFKTINDTLGHHAGDLFLQQISERLQHCLRKKDNISRMGGDEFIIILENITKNEARQVAERILTEMNTPILLFENKVIVTLSIGISMNLDFTCDGETLIKQADLAMYLAKEKGKNNYQFFTEDLNKKAIRKRQIKNALSLAIEQNEFKLFYQPQVDLQTGKLIGLEALLRWYPSFGNVSPVEFIPIAEETGLILPIGEWVIKEACLQIKKWKNQNRPKIKVSVNVSARQFKDKEFALKVKQILEDEKVDPSFIEFEITESVMLNAEEPSLLIREIKEMGIKVAIDDFGAGYSSLSVIKNVEIDTLKIDQSLLENVMQNSRMMSMLEAIIGVGKTLNTKIIVEGIETKEQLNLLNDFQIIGQGYFFSHPLPPEQLQDVWGRNWLQNE